MVKLILRLMIESMGEIKRKDTDTNFFYLKVHKIKNFFGSDFEFCTISLLVLLKYYDFVKNFFDCH